MTNIPKIVPESDNQSLQHFISESSWDEDGVITEVQRRVSKLIGDKENGSMHIDESGILKQGKDSVGVERQYCGRFGKVDNCQVGVFLSYANGNKRVLIDKRLYLPEKWAVDMDRRTKCGVPENIEFKKKSELGMDMILAAIKRNVPFNWLGMDCFYGQDCEFRKRLDLENITYVADIPSTGRVWLEKPKTEIIERKCKDGTLKKHIRVSKDEPAPVNVSTVAESDSVAWNHLFIRDTERKELWANIACLRVYPVENKLPAKECWLIIRKDDGEKEIKYQLSNAPEDTNIEKLGQMSASRYWIERALQDAKGELGMADYQVRGWTGWHHHMTMTILGMLFLLELLVEMNIKESRLTLQDVVEILEVILPKREINEEEIGALIAQKLIAKESARRSHHRRNKA